jgi:hypothetical protein
MVKVFGCRPSQAAREARGRRTETAQARTCGAQVRRYGDLAILAGLDGSRGDSEKSMIGDRGRRLRFAGAAWMRCGGGEQRDRPVLRAVVGLMSEPGARRPVGGVRMGPPVG